MNAAKETMLVNDQTLIDSKKLAKLKKDIDSVVFSDLKGKNVS